MKLSTSPHADGLVVTVEESRLDAAIATAFKDRMRALLPEAGDRIILDLSPVNFMDSSGLGAVIAVLKAMPEGHELILSGLTPNVERVFRLTHMNSVFKIIDRPGQMSGAAIGGTSGGASSSLQGGPESVPG